MQEDTRLNLDKFFLNAKNSVNYQPHLPELINKNLNATTALISFLQNPPWNHYPYLKSRLLFFNIPHFQTYP